MPRTARQKIITKLDRIVSEIIRARDGNKCVMCNGKKKLGCGHVFSRRNNSLRWDIREDGNCHAQCWKHNYLHSTRDSYPYYHWYSNKFGVKRLDKLHKEWLTIKKFSIPDLRELYARCQNFRDLMQK